MVQSLPLTPVQVNTYISVYIPTLAILYIPLPYPANPPSSLPQPAPPPPSSEETKPITVIGGNKPQQPTYNQPYIRTFTCTSPIPVPYNRYQPHY